MNPCFFLFIFLLQTGLLLAQEYPALNITPTSLGYRHLHTTYKGDSVDILVQSKKGEENKPKPIFFFCEGSTSRPMLLVQEGYAYPLFPFHSAGLDSLLAEYHIAIVSKPYIPVMQDVKDLDKRMCYNDPKTGIPPAKYLERNLLAYYSARNIYLIKYLKKQKWVSSEIFVVAGHSQGGRVAAAMAGKSKAVTHLIISCANPMGRMATMLAESRIGETDSLAWGDEMFQYWAEIVANKENNAPSSGDSPKNSYSFSTSMLPIFDKLKIPVLISYGTKDASCAFNDYARLRSIEKGQKTFISKLI